MEDHPWLRSIEAILFDLDGTLVATDNRWVEILTDKLTPWQRIFPRFQPESLARKLVMGMEMPGNYMVSALERLGLSSVLSSLGDRIRRSKGLATRENSVLLDGSLAMLERLDERYKMAVVTTRARPEACAFLDRLDLGRFFPVVITRQDVLFMKPHPEPVRKAAAGLGVPPERCLMVGDTTMDVRSARRAGVYVVGVLTGLSERSELERAGAHLILQSASQLVDYLPAPQAAGEARL